MYVIIFFIGSFFVVYNLCRVVGMDFFVYIWYWLKLELIWKSELDIFIMVGRIFVK